MKWFILIFLPLIGCGRETAIREFSVVVIRGTEHYIAWNSDGYVSEDDGVLHMPLPSRAVNEKTVRNGDVITIRAYKTISRQRGIFR